MKIRTARASAQALPWLALLALAACRAAGPDYAKPELAAPPSWSAALGAGAPEAAAPGLARWWHTFDDPHLDALIERAGIANLDLAQARARVLQARAAARRAGAELEPRVDARAGYQRSLRSLNASTSSPLAGDRENDLFQAGFDASWELDLYGGLARSAEASQAELEAAAADLGSARVTLVAEIARAYAELRGAQRRRAVAEGSLRSQEASADLVSSRVDAGVASELDLARARALAAGTRARLPELQRDAIERSDRLALLLGQPAGALLGELEAPAPIPRARALPDTGLPAQLLERRPDLRRAERKLAAQTARIGAAEAERYPQLRLLGSIGFASTELRDLPEARSLAWSVGPSLSLPLLDAGRIDAEVELQRARTDELALAYRQALLAALKEVEDALHALESARARSEALETAVAQQTRANDLAEELYDAGLSDFLSVLDVQRALFDLQDQLAQSRTTESTQVAAVCKALGGGWDPDAPLRALEAAAPGAPGAPGASDGANGAASKADATAAQGAPGGARRAGGS